MQFLSLHTFDETYPQPHAIRLNPLLKPEALRRLAWSVFYLDTMADAGRHGIHTVTETGYHLQLPADEASFMRGVDVVTSTLVKHPSSRGLSSPKPWDPAMDLIMANGSLTSCGSGNGNGNGNSNGTLSRSASASVVGTGNTPVGQNAAAAAPGLSVPPANHSGISPPPNAHVGIASHLIRTAAMRRRILHFNSLLKYSGATPSQMVRSLRLLESDLRAVIVDLSPDLGYSEDNLFLHSERRTMFVLFHMMRHNCFLMLLWAKLNVASRHPDPPESTHTLMQERIKHAFGVAGIVADAVRLGVSCDPFVGVQAYTALEGESVVPPSLAFARNLYPFDIDIRIMELASEQSC